MRSRRIFSYCIKYNHKIINLAVSPHKLGDENSGLRGGDDGRDTKTTNAGLGQASLVRALATATVCSVPGLRIGTGLGGEPCGPGSPDRVQLTAAPEGTEVEAHDLKDSAAKVSNYSLSDSAAMFHRHVWPTRPRDMTEDGDGLP
jgi:hypothetical protein